MAYRFKLKEGLRDGVRRIAVEQVDRVLQAPRKGDDRATWVHDTRKAMKRTRALLKCVRSGLDPQVYRDENAALGAIARDLSNWRDRDVMAQTMSMLASEDEDLETALAWLTDQLNAPGETTPVRSPSRSADAAVRRAVKALEKAQARLAKLDVSGEFVETVGAGLRVTQRNGREALTRLTVDAGDDALHDLRKMVQIYQRQQSLIVAVWPDMQSVRIEAARALAQLLGEAQDLIVLAGTARSLAESETTTDSPCGAKTVDGACRARLEGIRAAALPMAARLFASRPSAVEREFSAGWAAAVALGSAAASSSEKPEPNVLQKRATRVTAP